jgi:tetratricopeptide (TPR) repeat protein
MIRPMEKPSANRRQALPLIVVAVLAGAAAAIVPHTVRRHPVPAAEPMTIGPHVGMPGAPPTSAEGLGRQIRTMDQRLQENPHDAGAAVLLADALLRQARATNDARPANRAGEILKGVLKETPSQYDALRLLGAIYLSQHRFRDAIEIARHARDLRPLDAWNYGVIGDGLVELGEYDEAFHAFDTMVTMRPNAAAYARVAYGRELRGELDGAAEAMRMAEQATPVQDPEAQAWYAAQMGELFLRMGKLEDANRAYRRAAFLFPNYPHAMVGQGKVKDAIGDHEGALAIYRAQLQRTPTLDLAARIGDLHAKRGDTVEAERYYQMAEDLAGPGPAQTEANLALFLAEHDRKLSEAVKIAETVARTRRDVFTDDALAWAYYKVGRVDEAKEASQRALRIGTRDPRIVWHASQIEAASVRQH